MSARTFVARGSVCGSCSHAHRTLSGAQACADRHQAAIVRGNPGGRAYSDREVTVLEPGDGPDNLTEWELEYLREEVQS